MNYSKPFCLFRMNPSIFRDLLGLAAGLAISAMAQAPGGEGFGAPEQAVTALREGLRAKDADRLKAIFGPEVEDLVNPDRVQATNEFQMVSEAIEEAHSLVNAGEGRLLLEYGKEKNLFPVPLLKVGDRWFFDTAQGKEEVINRRIGRNELDALETIRTYVQAQREYASADRDGDEVLEYAQKFRSNEGTKDGLYWPQDLDGSISPLGPFVAEAGAEGYRKKTGAEPQAFHGYYFRILTRQGPHAPGAAYDYIINGNMIGGFGLVAWPAEYDETGVMTFIVNQQGRVYQKDLGATTAKTAESLELYDPDKSWMPSRE